jgi:hypothetical protein
VHWRKLPYWIFLPIGLALVGSIALLWYHPAGAPVGPIWAAFMSLLASHVFTGLFWGRWQAKLSRDERGSASPYLARMLSTHWIRTALISGYAFMLLGCALALWA